MRHLLANHIIKLACHWLQTAGPAHVLLAVRLGMRFNEIYEIYEISE